MKKIINNFVNVSTLKKSPFSAKSVISTLIFNFFGRWEREGGVGWGWALIWVWVGGGGAGVGVGGLLTFSAFRIGAYSRWALIRGWALIRINTVIASKTENCSLWRHTTFWVVFSFLSTTTLFGSNMRTFMDSHLDDIHCGWVSGIKGVGGFITVQPAL